jgi:hypothetical protein
VRNKGPHNAYLLFGVIRAFSNNAVIGGDVECMGVSKKSEVEVRYAS